MRTPITFFYLKASWCTVSRAQNLSHNKHANRHLRLSSRNWIGKPLPWAKEVEICVVWDWFCQLLDCIRWPGSVSGGRVIFVLSTFIQRLDSSSVLLPASPEPVWTSLELIASYRAATGCHRKPNHTLKKPFGKNNTYNPFPSIGDRSITRFRKRPFCFKYSPVISSCQCQTTARHAQWTDMIQCSESEFGIPAADWTRLITLRKSRSRRISRRRRSPA